MSSIKLDAVNKYRRQIKYNFFNKKFDAEQKKKSWGEFLKIYTGIWCRKMDLYWDLYF